MLNFIWKQISDSPLFILHIYVYLIYVFTHKHTHISMKPRFNFYVLDNLISTFFYSSMFVSWVRSVCFQMSMSASLLTRVLNMAFPLLISVHVSGTDSTANIYWVCHNIRYVVIILCGCSHVKLGKNLLEVRVWVCVCVYILLLLVKKLSTNRLNSFVKLHSLQEKQWLY